MFRNYLEAKIQQLIPKLAEFSVALTLFGKKLKVANATANGLLLDANIHGWSVTHESVFVLTGDIQWGSIVEKGGAGYLARAPKYDSNDTSKEFLDIKYLVPISRLANMGYLKLWSSGELFDEMFRQPSGRYRGYSLENYCLLPNTTIKLIDDIPYRDEAWLSWDRKQPLVDQKERLNNKKDPLYRSLAACMSEKHSQDVWHVYTAEKYGLFCLLTMDYKFINAVRRVRKKDAWSTLNTRVLSPSEFGKELGLTPIDPNMFAYTGLKFGFSRPDIVSKPKFFKAKKK